VAKYKNPWKAFFILLFVGTAILLANSTGNFILTDSSALTATSDDYFYAAIASITNFAPNAALISPDGKILHFGSNVHLGTIVIAKVNFNGTVISARRYDTCEQVSINQIVTVGSLIGAHVNGTWTIKEPINSIGLASPVQINLKGKVYDDVSNSGEPIELCGNGLVTSGTSQYTHLKFWNWHMQSPNSRYDTGHLTNLHPVENPAYAQFSSTALSGSNFYDGFEDGTLPPFSGSWSIISGGANGFFSAKSAQISHSQNSNTVLVHNAPAGFVSFKLKISSEKGFDFLRFYIDGVKYGEWSGEKDWLEASYPVAAGAHTFTWSYEKDASRSEGQDAAWIDEVRIANSIPVLPIPPLPPVPPLPPLPSFVGSNYSDGFEDGTLSPFYTSPDGFGQWSLTTSNVFSGTFSAQSRAWSNTWDDFSDLSLNNLWFGPSGGRVTFALRTSSPCDNINGHSDRLRFIINQVWTGAVAADIYVYYAGGGTFGPNTPWQTVSFNVNPGNWNFLWRWDMSFICPQILGVPNGRAYIDNVVIEGLIPPPV
jgi:hypothetical protein